MDKSRDSHSKVFPNKAASLQSLALLDSNSISGHTGSFKCCAAGDGPRVFWILGIVDVQHESAAWGRRSRSRKQGT
jgi:hypothetical protein